MTANQFDVYDIDTDNTSKDAVPVGEESLVHATNGSEVSVITTAHNFTVRIEDEALAMTREEGEALHAALASALGFTD